jgi:hypothetical protein
MYRDQEDYEAWIERMDDQEQAAMDEAERRADIEREERMFDRELPEYPEG